MPQEPRRASSNNFKYTKNVPWAPTAAGRLGGAARDEVRGADAREQVHLLLVRHEVRERGHAVEDLTERGLRVSCHTTLGYTMKYTKH